MKTKITEIRHIGITVQDLKKSINYLDLMEYKKFMKNFSPKVVAEKYSKIYKDLIK